MRQTRSRITRRCIGASIAVLMLVVLGARPAAAQVLDQVPSDALVVLKVKNLQATSTKVAKYCNDLGVAAMVPQLNDPLKALEDHLKVSQGINAGGDLFVAFMNPTGGEGGPDKSIVILFPVSDYKAFWPIFPTPRPMGM
jgi:hypothetical protein